MIPSAQTVTLRRQTNNTLTKHPTAEHHLSISTQTAAYIAHLSVVTQERRKRAPMHHHHHHHHRLNGLLSFYLDTGRPEWRLL